MLTLSTDLILGVLIYNFARHDDLSDSGDTINSDLQLCVVKFCMFTENTKVPFVTNLYPSKYP